MQDNNDTKNSKITTLGQVHIILSHSYSVFMFFLIASIIIDAFVKKQLFSVDVYYNYTQYISCLLIFIGSCLIYWAQISSSKSKKEMILNNEDRKFTNGPYKYSRNPTHIGLLFMTIGFGMLLNSVVVTTVMILAFIVTKIVFIKKEENVLLQNYGKVYENYKKKVRTWI